MTTLVATTKCGVGVGGRRWLFLRLLLPYSAVSFPLPLSWVVVEVSGWRRFFDDDFVVVEAVVVVVVVLVLVVVVLRWCRSLRPPFSSSSSSSSSSVVVVVVLVLSVLLVCCFVCLLLLVLFTVRISLILPVVFFRFFSFASSCFSLYLSNNVSVSLLCFVGSLRGFASSVLFVLRYLFCRLVLG